MTNKVLGNTANGGGFYGKRNFPAGNRGSLSGPQAV